MKKILSLVLAMMMVLSMANIAFAAPQDVTDKNQQKAVDALMALGIVTGYEDGSYKPEKVVTRAEMAKLLVESKGQGSFAQGSESSFRDTKGTWYDGYVAMAAGLDLVKGYPDGTFKGDNPVSYQEAVVMVLRSLGYTDATVNNGVNAYNESKYKALAASLEILKNVTFKSGGANRGDIASMLYNSLDVPVVETNEKGKAERIVLYTESLQDGTKTTTVPVYKTLIDSILTAVPITIEPSFVDSSKSDYKGSYVDLTPYMYQNVTAYMNDQKEIVVVKKVNSRVITGVNDSLDSDHVDYQAGTLKVTTESGTTKKAYLPLASSIKCFLNNRETTIAGNVLSGDGYLAGAEVTFILNSDNEVTAAVAKQPTYGILVTTPYKAGDVVLKGIEGRKNSVANIYLPKNGTKVDLSKVKVTGAVTAIEDIQKNDVVVAFASQYTKNQAPEYVELLVTRDTIEGKITKTTSNVVLTIEGESYYTAYYAGYYTGGLYNEVGVGSEGTFYLDQDGYIFAFSGKSINNSEYAVVLDIVNGYVAPSSTTVVADASISILNKERKVTKYSFAKDAQYSIDGGTLATVWNNHASRTLDTTFVGIKGSYMNTLVTGFDLNANSQIVKIEFKTLTPATTAVNVNSKSFTLSNDVAIYNVYGTVGELKYNVLDKANLVNAAAPTGSPVYYFAINSKTGEIEAVVYNASVGIGNKIVVRSMPNVINDGVAVKSILSFNNGESVEYFSKTAISVPTAPEASGVTPVPGKSFADQPNNIVPNSYRGLLIDAEIDARGYITTWSVVNANFANTAVTSSAINVLSDSLFTITDKNITGSTSPKSYGLSDNAVVYYIARDNWENMSAPVVGTIADIGKSNAHVLFYNLDTTNDEFGVTHFEVIIVIDDVSK